MVYKKFFLLGWFAILILCLALYDSLLFNQLHAEVRQSVISTASMATNSIEMKLSTGIRLGKRIAAFRGLEDIVRNAADSFPGNMGVAIVDSHDSHTIYAVGSQNYSLQNKQIINEKTVTFEDDSFLDIASPIKDKKGSLLAYSIIKLSKESIEQQTLPLIYKQIKLQLAGLAGLLLLSSLLYFVPLVSPSGVIYKKRVYGIFIGVFLIFIGINALVSIQTYKEQYTRTLKINTERIGQTVAHDMNRLLLVGVTIGQMDNVQQYLQNMSNSLSPGTVLTLVNSSGVPVTGTHPKGTPVVEGIEQNISLYMPRNSSFLHVNDVKTEGEHWNINIGVSSAEYQQSLMNIMLNTLTLAIISAVFMLEGFFLLISCYHAQQSQKLSGLSHSQRSSLLRPLMFIYILAMDMSISFIPLRMANIIPADALVSRDLLMGLPISAEMAMTGISMIFTGTWMKHKGIVPPMTCGILLTCIGYFGSMLSMEPWQFILARGIVGTGYGLALLSAQAHTVTDGKLTDMFAGVYAGSLCGSALGAILAEQLGYSAVFAVSGCILLPLVIIPFLLMKEKYIQAEIRKVQPPRVPLKKILKLLITPKVLALVFFSLLPGAFLCVGFLNYFLPVYLHNAEISQSAIGRIFMLYCLVIIYAGPILENFANKIHKKSYVLAAAGVIGSGTMLCFALLPTLQASLLGAILLGISTSFNVASQSAYMLEQPIARLIGTDQSMSIVAGITRVGQVLGPVFTGFFLGYVDVETAAAWAGTAFLVITFLFLVLTNLPETSRQD